MKLNFVSLREFVDDIHKFADTLDNDYDFIIGVPRSGLLPATIIATRLGITLASLDNVDELTFLGHSRKTKPLLDLNYKKALLIDDSTHSGESMRKAIENIGDCGYMLNINKAAIYGKVDNEIKIYKKIPDPRIFEWNLFSHVFLKSCCCDIDGVLCRDPTNEENDDGPNYEWFLKTVKPKFRPTIEINTLVTARLEKYRAQTENWLKLNDIKYKKLIMSQYKSKEERVFNNDHAQMKAKVYRSDEYIMFIESSEVQAKKIAELTRKPVICTDTMVIYNG